MIYLCIMQFRSNLGEVEIFSLDCELGFDTQIKIDHLILGILFIYHKARKKIWLNFANVHVLNLLSG